MQWKKSFPYFLFQAIFCGGLSSFWKTAGLYRRWKSSFYGTPLGEGLPWLTFAAIAYLEDHLCPEHSIFEWGGGGSTVFFTGRCARVVTVDDNPYWFGQFPRVDNWTGLLRRANTSVGWADYVLAIADFPEGFDVVLVDGLARPDCIAIAHKYLKPGGLLVVDDAQVPAYAAAVLSVMDFYEVVSGDYGPTPFHPDFKISLILRRRG